jgi:outer membrane protein assembly factor BamB
LTVKPPAIKPPAIKSPPIKPPPPIKPATVKPTIPAHYTAQNIAPGDGFCETHPQLRATSACNACRKPICLECRQHWGYYCSEACRDSSLSSLDRKIKSDHRQENAKLSWVVRIIKIVILVTTCVIFGFVGMWIWRMFLDPGGKVAWVWNKPDASIQLIKTTPKRLVTLTNSDIITLDSQTGKVISSFRNNIFASMHLNKIMDDKLILSGGKTVALVDFSAKEKWQTSFKDPIANVAIGSEVALVTTRHWVESKKTYRTRAGRFLCPPTAVTHLSAVELEQGKVLWHILKPKNDFSIVAIGDKNYISLGAITVKKKSKTVLKVNDLRTRKELGQIKLSAYPTMGPLLYNGNIIFRIKENLYAIDMTGKTIWSAKVEGYCSDYNFKANDDLAFFATASGLTVFDMKQGKVLWNKSLDAKRIAYISGKLLMKVYEVDEAYSKRHKNDKAPKLPPAYEQLKKGDPVITAMLGGNRGKEVRYNRFIVCLDARTGKRLWKSAKIRGQLLVGAGRVVIFRDAIIAAQLSAISSKRLGKSIVEQLSLETGEQLFKRQDDIGVTAPKIIGNKLVGYLYDRNYDNTKSIGLAGFNLK